MSIGLVGRKCGMTRVFTDAGVTVPVTVVEALPNRISQVKNDKTDGYRAVQVTIGSRRPSRVAKAWPVISPRPMSPPATPPRNSAWARAKAKPSPPAAKSKSTCSRSGQIVDVTGTTVGQGLPGHHEAAQLCRRHENPRQLGVAPRAGLHRPAPDAGARVQGQAHVGPHGRCAIAPSKTCASSKSTQRGICC